MRQAFEVKNSGSSKYLSDYNCIIFSKPFRRLRDKTQLFSSIGSDHFRSRLTHTIEVCCIAKQIALGINKKLNREIIDVVLTETIALAHDIGHTPFGHIGERTLMGIFSRMDSLGIINGEPNSYNKIYFKHNLNSLRVLLDEFPELSWEVLDGAFKHGSIRYGDDNIEKAISVVISGSKLNKIKDYYKTDKPLTLEGQIVSIADDIAQRCADLDDSKRARYFQEITELVENIKPQLINFQERSDYKSIDLLINDIQTFLINDTILSSTSVLAECNSIEPNYNIGVKECFINFSEAGRLLNKTLSDFIYLNIIKMTEIRRSDAVSKQIIRQLFKAYYNNPRQLSDKCLNDIIKNLKKYINNNSKTIKNELETFLPLANYETNLLFSGNFLTGKVFDFDVLDKVFEIAKIINNNNSPESLQTIGNIYIREIGYFIANMTDEYARNCYRQLYGIK